MYEYFVSRKGKVIQPTGSYFVDNGRLTELGCMLFREVVMRESGIKSYWFGAKRK